MMAGWDLAFSALLALLLVGMIVASLRLDSSLRVMRRDRGAFEVLVSNLASANQSVALGIQALREEADRAARQVTHCVSEADKMATDLSFLVEAADNAGHRLEARVRETRSARGVSSAAAPPPESRIVRAARMLRAARSVPDRAGASGPRPEAAPFPPQAPVPVPAGASAFPDAAAPAAIPGVSARTSMASGEPPSGPLRQAGITLRRRTHAPKPSDPPPSDARASA